MAVNAEYIGCKIIELDVKRRLPIVVNCLWLDDAIFHEEIKLHIRSFSIKRMNFVVDLNALIFTFSEGSKWIKILKDLLSYLYTFILFTILHIVSDNMVLL